METAAEASPTPLIDAGQGQVLMLGPVGRIDQRGHEQHGPHSLMWSGQQYQHQQPLLDVAAGAPQMLAAPLPPEGLVQQPWPAVSNAAGNQRCLPPTLPTIEHPGQPLPPQQPQQPLTWQQQHWHRQASSSSGGAASSGGSPWEPESAAGHSASSRRSQRQAFNHRYPAGGCVTTSSSGGGSSNTDSTSSCSTSGNMQPPSRQQQQQRQQRRIAVPEVDEAQEGGGLSCGSA